VGKIIASRPIILPTLRFCMYSESAGLLELLELLELLL